MFAVPEITVPEGAVGAVSVITIVLEPPAAIEPRVHVTVVVPLHDHPGALTETNVAL